MWLVCMGHLDTLYTHNAIETHPFPRFILLCCITTCHLNGFLFGFSANGPTHKSGKW